MTIKITKPVVTEREGETIEEFFINEYHVMLTRYNGNSEPWYRVFKRSGCERKYLPEISPLTRVFDKDERLIGFYVHTTSYGPLPVSEMEQFVHDMEEGCAIAQELNNRFLK